jgi:hypothetical protein
MNKFNIKSLFFFLLLAMLTISSCESETEELDESVFGYRFFPVQEGKTWIYASDSIIYSASGTRKDTLKSFIKEVIGTPFKDLEGNDVNRLERYFRRLETDPWTKTNTWTVLLDKTRAIRTEENIKFVKLVFPIKKGLRFDGNVFVDEDIKIPVGGEQIEAYKNWKHRMEEIDEKVSFKGDSIKSIRVNLVDENSIIDRRKVTEYYGEGIGLIKKEMMILDSDGSRPNDAWEAKAQKGFIHTLTLIEVQ